MAEWREGRLADACASIDYGLTASAKETPVGPKFLRITDIVATALDWRRVPYTNVSDKDHNKFRLDHGDIVIARTGATTGESRFIQNPPDSIFASYLVRLKINDENHARFISYWLKSSFFWDYLRGVLGDKSAQPNASASTMTHAPIKIPADRNEQAAIATFLGALDDKIELNRRTNETLEETARAIFRDWFVDFGPTRAKMAMRGEDPQKDNIPREPYLAPDLWALFPDRLNDATGLPEGWDEDTLGRLADTNSESWTTRNHPQTIEYVDLANTKWGNIESTSFLDWENAPSRARRVARDGDTIIGTTRPGNGSFSYVSKNGLTVSTGFAALTPKDKIYREIVYLAATSSKNIKRLANLADGHGGAYPAVKPNEVLETAFAFPGDKILAAFACFVSDLRKQIEHSKSESFTLARTRDLLLPKLMSGEIRLRGAEKIAGEVA